MLARKSRIGKNIQVIFFKLSLFLSAKFLYLNDKYRKTQGDLAFNTFPENSKIVRELIEIVPTMVTSKLKKECLRNSNRCYEMFHFITSKSCYQVE